MALDLTLALPIMVPRAEDDAQRRLQDRALDEWQSLGVLDPLDPVFGGAPLRLRVGGDPADEPLLRGLWQPPVPSRRYRLLVLETDGRACLESIRGEASPEAVAALSEQELLRWSEQDALACLRLEANTALMLANIVRPGALSAAAGHAFAGGRRVEGAAPFFAEHLFWAHQASRAAGWPRLSPPEFRPAWEWLRASGALKDGIGRGPLGRALAAVSHLTTASLEENSSIDLVWILMGLEALYARGREGLSDQLLGKTEALLGRREQNRKAFSAAYNFRSRLLHGDVDLPLRFTEFGGVKPSEDFYASLIKNTDLALAVLLATLQWMISHGVRELDFEYAFKAAGRDVPPRGG